MNDLEILAQAIRDNPEEDAPRAAYFDCLQEVYGGDPALNLILARDFWDTIRDAHRIGRAVQLVRGTGDVARRMQWLTHRELSHPSPLEVPILITRGYLLPCGRIKPEDWALLLDNERGIEVIGVDLEQQVVTPPPRPYVLVGADWLLATAARHGLIPEPVSLYEPTQPDE